MEQNEYNAYAMYIGHRILVNKLHMDGGIGSNPLVIESGERGRIVIFRYGVIVCFGLNALERGKLVDDLSEYIINPFEHVSEQIGLVLDEQNEAVIQERIHMLDFSVQRLQVIAEVLARAVVLDYYEQTMTKTFDQIEPLSQQLKQKSRIMSNDKVLLSQIGDILSIQGKMVGRVEVSEKPEVLWEYPELERLYQKLEDEFEIKERHVALERKLTVITDSAETMLDLLNIKRSLRVEWYIVILIVIEILLTLNDKFFHIV